MQSSPSRKSSVQTERVQRVGLVDDLDVDLPAERSETDRFRRQLAAETWRQV